jgi:exodeoxyribonuclease VII small subunit
VTKKKIHFEKAMAELSSIVDDLEAGELSLDDALKTFEKGVSLTRQCQDALQQAEQRVQILLETALDAESVDDYPPSQSASSFMDFDEEDT